MIDIGSISGLFEREHQLLAYCHRCDRWSLLDLQAMVRRGLGERRLPLKVRCHLCREKGTIQVRPPMPARSSTGWIAPPAGQEPLR